VREWRGRCRRVALLGLSPYQRAATDGQPLTVQAQDECFGMTKCQGSGVLAPTSEARKIDGVGESWHGLLPLRIRHSTVGVSDPIN